MDHRLFLVSTNVQCTCVLIRQDQRGFAGVRLPLIWVSVVTGIGFKEPVS
jgi:hypothetical protein